MERFVKHEYSATANFRCTLDFYSQYIFYILTISSFTQTRSIPDDDDGDTY